MEKIFVDIITIGDEILLGHTVDTNSAWLGKMLADNGFTVRRIVSISDSESEIKTVLANSLEEVSFILITGGLGPTNDDITKICLTDFFGGTLIEHPEAYANMARFVLERNGSINSKNKEQALFPDNAEFIANSCGTASGMWFSKNGKVVVSMPGVPHEMKAMVEQEVLPKAKTAFMTPHIYYQILLVGGIPEAALAEKLTVYEEQLPSNVSLAYLPSPGLIKLRLLATSANAEAVHELIDEQFSLLKEAIGKSFIIGETLEDDTDVVADALANSKVTVATAESCTGGAIATRLTATPGSSAYFLGSIVAYSNAVKQNLLAVPEEIIRQNGAVSQPVVECMAENVRKAMGSDYGIATSGVAGPSGGSDEKPVGTVWIAIAGPSKTISHKFSFGSDRERTVQRSVQSALHLLLQEIRE